MIHAAVEKRLGGRAATVVNAAAFSSVHLLHHGIRQASTGLPFTWVSGALWFMMMMGLSWFLTQCRTQGGSIWPAVAAHAAFNLVTNVTIFWVLL
jgi:membrane protease YdiL (CAAX protease family)